MSHRAVFGTVLAVGLVLAPRTDAQVAWEGPGHDPDRGILVRPVSEVGRLERIHIGLTQGFIPGLTVFAPLYACGRALACDDHAARDAGLHEHEGSAAILVCQDNGINRAYYYRTVRMAITAARSADWCGDDSADLTWHLATSRRLDGDTVKEKGRYLSREVKRIKALRQQQP